MQLMHIYTIYMYSYNVQMVHELKPIDHQEQLNCAIQNLSTGSERPQLYRNLITGDETPLHLNVFANEQNTRSWGIEYQRELHSLKITVWRGAKSRRKIRSYLFELGHNNTSPAKGGRYLFVATRWGNFLLVQTQNETAKVGFQKLNNFHNIQS